jgi:Ni,Fe-hydrogenase III small subunit
MTPATGGIYKGSYAVLGEVDKILPVDMKILGNPISPEEILKGLLTLLKKVSE